MELYLKKSYLNTPSLSVTFSSKIFLRAFNSITAPFTSFSGAPSAFSFLTMSPYKKEKILQTS